ncbi:hypothetical protein CRG98_016521 [Punica granatum]|uniref:Uncharacterized protein n=1 Tax=Punica granatum TaxID=22663 RepID=A0A2I0K4K1_PUNGR|nr:hypothetical protein CRG98_016521 [Punica granatum]
MDSNVVLVGTRMRAFGSRGMGVSTFPGNACRTRVRSSRHLPFYDPRSRAGKSGSGVHVTYEPIFHTPFRYSYLLGLQF